MRCCWLLDLPTYAQDYPSRPVELVVPFAAGGGSELLARLISDGLSKRLGQPFLVINRPGANTNLGTLSVVRAKPDGYTLAMSSVGLAANPSLYKKLNFEPQKDLEPISLIANSPTVLAVPPALPVNSLAEFIAYAKARPGELNYGSYGAGSGPHLATELFAAITGVQNACTCRMAAAGRPPLGAMTNQVQALFSSVLPVLGMVRGEKLKALAIAADRRSELLPDVPTFAEQGHRLSHRHLVRAAGAGPNARSTSSPRSTARPSRRSKSQACARRSSNRAPR